MKNRLEDLPFFFLTIPAFFILNSNNYYFGLLDWSLIQHELLFYVGVPFVLYILLRFIVGSWRKAAILIAWLLVLFYFFFPLHQVLRSVPYVNKVAQYKILLPLLLVCVAGSGYYLSKSKSAFTRHHMFINVLFLALLMLEIGVGIYYKAIEKIEQHDLADRHKQLSNNFLPCDTCQQPDIYFLIFDEYASDSILKNELNYSNASFTGYLKDKGFYVAEQAKSNYNFTHLSLASELSLCYLHGMDRRSRFYTRDYLKGGYTVYRNELFKVLKKQGYRLENYSIFDIEGYPAHSIKPFKKEQAAFILNRTFFKTVDADIGWKFRNGRRHFPAPSPEDISMQDEDITRMEQTKNGVMHVARSAKDSPVFTYAHFLLPHPPFYYDSNGTRLSRRVSLYATNAAYYTQQLVYANKFVIRPLLDAIFKESGRPFIIILQGDHGYRNFTAGKEHLEFSNLNAIYFPDKDYNGLYPQISSVNTFRVVLNKYFHTRLPLLKDTSYYLIRNLDR